MRKCLVALLLLGICPALPAVSPAPPDDDKKDTQEDPAHKEAHKELIALREEVVAALDKLGSKDKDADEAAMKTILAHLDDNVLVTYMDANVARKPAGVKAYFEKMMKGDKALVKHYKPKIEVDEKTHLYPAGESPTSGVITGKSLDHFDLNDGRQFDITVRWTAALVKTKDSKWKIAGFHSSADVFHNPIKDLEVQRATYMWGGIGAGAGLLLGIILTALLKGRRA